MYLDTGGILRMGRPPRVRLDAAGLGGGGVSYLNKVLGIAPANLIGYWPMNEAAGATVSLDHSGQANNGAYTAVTLGAAGIGDGNTAASFDGTTSFNNIYSAALNADFNNAEGTLAIWARVSAAGVWTDATLRYLAQVNADATNLALIRKTAVDNTIECNYRAGGVSESITFTSLGGVTTFFHVAITWSVAGDAVKAYANGVQVGTTQTGLGTWSGALASNVCNLGANANTPTAVFSGFLAHAALWTTPLSAAQILALATVP